MKAGIMRIMAFNLPQCQLFLFLFYLCGFEKILTNMETLASKILHDQSWATLNSEKKICICFVTTSIINDTFADVLDTFIGG